MRFIKLSFIYRVEKKRWARGKIREASPRATAIRENEKASVPGGNGGLKMTGSKRRKPRYALMRARPSDDVYSKNRASIKDTDRTERFAASPSCSRSFFFSNTQAGLEIGFPLG
jgi:hypothetical protein